MESYDGEEGLSKHSRDSRKDRSGRTYRGYNQQPERVPKRQHNTIVDFEGVDGHSGAGLSLDKDKRWEVVEQLKKDDRYIIVERDKKDTRMQKVQIDQKVRQTYKFVNGEDEANTDDMSVDEEEKFKKEYRVTKGGPNGVMISKRRTPGKKGVKKQAEKNAKKSAASRESSSESSEEDSAVEDDRRGYVIVERMDKHIEHDRRRKGSSWCNCEMCNPVEPHYERAKQRREFLDEIKHL